MIAGAGGAILFDVDVRPMADAYHGGEAMNFDQCHDQLVALRRKQKTRYPLVRIDCGGATYRGRLTRADSDPEYRELSPSPYGILILEGLGLTRSPETILQIANIPSGGIKELEND